MAEKTGLDQLAYVLAAAYVLYIFIPSIGHLGALVLSGVGIIAFKLKK